MPADRYGPVSKDWIFEAGGWFSGETSPKKEEGQTKTELPGNRLGKTAHKFLF